MEYARRHPDRVSHLILVGAFVEGRLARSTSPDQAATNEMQRDLIRMGWGLDDHSHRLYFSSTFIPDADPALWTSFAELLRRTTSAESALRIFDASAWVDASQAAAEVDVPTLILHARDEQRIPFGQALEYASLIRDSKLVPLETRNHLMVADEPAWAQALDEIDAFLGDGAAATAS